MTRFSFTGLSLVLSLISGLIWPVSAFADTSERQAIIHEQIQAFQADDTRQAWSYAAPAIQVRFGDADQFMSMVRSQYQPLYRPRAYTMGETVETPRGPGQIVHVIDDQGRPWRALYLFTADNKDEWKISGCYLHLLPGEDI